MKKILLVIFAFISLNAFSQLQVKDGSFKYIPGGIIEDKEEYTDGNDFPMALIKVSTENISEQERMRLVFTGNRETQILKEPKTGEIWIYISADPATFINIKHPDYGVIKYMLPEKLCDYCVYEMVLQYVNADAEMMTGFLVVVSEPLEADVYIDGKYNGKTVKVITDIAVGAHELEISKQGYYSVKKNVTIAAGETININETLLPTKKEISISTGQSGDKIYVDGNYAGTSPLTTNLSYGSHEIKVERAGKTISTTINVTQSGGDDGEKLAFKQEIDGHEYVDLGLSVKWATCNIGANKPEEYGDYFAWGETSAKFSYKNDNSKTYYRSMGDIKGDSSYDAATANWGGNWRMPTKAEMQELRDRCNWEWITQNGVNGYKVTGPNGNSIFLPAAGYCFGSSVSRVQKRGEYWGSTPNGVDPSSAYQLYFNGVKRKVMSYGIRYYGQSVRPVIEPVVEIEPIVEPEPVVEKSLTIKKDKRFIGANLGIGNDLCAGMSVSLGADVAFPINKTLNLGGYAYFGNTGLGVGGLAVIDFKNESSIVGGLGFALSDYYSWPDVGFKWGYKFANGIYLTYTISTEVWLFNFCYDFGRFL